MTDSLSKTALVEQVHSIMGKEYGDVTKKMVESAWTIALRVIDSNLKAGVAVPLTHIGTIRPVSRGDRAKPGLRYLGFKTSSTYKGTAATKAPLSQSAKDAAKARRAVDASIKAKRIQRRLDRFNASTGADNVYLTPPKEINGFPLTAGNRAYIENRARNELRKAIASKGKTGLSKEAAAKRKAEKAAKTAAWEVKRFTAAARKLEEESAKNKRATQRGLDKQARALQKGSAKNKTTIEAAVKARDAAIRADEKAVAAERKAAERVMVMDVHKGAAGFDKAAESAKKAVTSAKAASKAAIKANRVAAAAAQKAKAASSDLATQSNISPSQFLGKFPYGPAKKPKPRKPAAPKPAAAPKAPRTKTTAIRTAPKKKKAAKPKSPAPPKPKSPSPKPKSPPKAKPKRRRMSELDRLLA